MLTTTQIGAVALFVLSASEDVLGLPLLATRQNSTASAIGNFGSCSVPQIEFGVGFDNRKETSFQPVDKTSFNHGSAQGIDIITKFICDTLTNSCGADATAKATCATASTAADGQTAKTGAQADAFNGVFGIKTNFAAVPVVNDQGVTLGVDGSSTAAAGSNNAGATATTVAGSDSGTTSAVVVTSSAVATASAADPCTEIVTVTVTASTAASTGSSDAAGNATSTDSSAASGAATASNSTTGATASNSTSATTSSSTGTGATASNSTTGAAASSGAASSSIGDFGSCSVPQIEFGVGFDNRKETSFQPVDQTSFNHGSADNIKVITDFICNTLTNSCNADATAKATCAQAQTAANAATALTGAQADAFNAVFNIQTNFAAVPVVSNTGVTQSAAAAGASATDA